MIGGVIFYIILLIFSTYTLIYAIQHPGEDVDIEKVNKNVRIYSGGYNSYKCYLNDGDYVRISFEVSDYHYGVNLYVVDDENYEKFKNGQDFIYIYGVIEKVAMGGYSGFTADSDGFYSIIFYNYNFLIAVDIKYNFVIYRYTTRAFNPINLVFPVFVWIIGIIGFPILIVTSIQKKKEKTEVIVNEKKIIPEITTEVSERRYCSNCGEKIKKEATFCEFCGNKQ